jgi:coproporphyrinogen III oxidase-like Fe-S oxidoreductase
VAGERRVHGPRLAAYIDDPRTAPATIEVISERTRLEERLMLGLRLADGVALDEIAPVLDPAALDRLTGLGLAQVEDGRLRLAQRGRMLLHDCVAELIDDEPA